MRSLSEIDTIVKRASKGVGYSWGIAEEVGKNIAKLALSKGIKECCFDRNGYLYHGRVKSLAESARKEGLKF